LLPSWSRRRGSRALPAAGAVLRPPCSGSRMSALDKLSTALGERVKLRRQDGFQAQCPAHEDDRASLAVKRGQVGVVMKCHAGCTAEAVVESLKMKMSDL